ncbi:hypothetical protein BZG36_03889 [Bifiguratus adelaidae]|uniref:Elongation of fatty acids protein n=1 Tax=Bifiguratus adelaidae TaxID=1938954 RepID=A0A261XXV3_9FUNG|nr:hypothetical protein BZG36_03889 [Bifiguratus adelaidae]
MTNTFTRLRATRLQSWLPSLISSKSFFTSALRSADRPPSQRPAVGASSIFDNVVAEKVQEDTTFPIGTEKAEAKEYRFSTANFKASPQKLNMLARQIRGLPLSEAIAQMTFSPKRAAVKIRHNLAFAQKNALLQKGMKSEGLVVSQAWVGKGQYSKRIKIHGRGRMGVMHQSKGEVKIKQTTSSPLFVACIFLHNLALAVYSGWTFYHTFTVYRRNLKTMDFWTVWCDKSGDFWTSTLGLYGYYFYLSKYYEIVDTIIILLKGRKSSTLQTYHHAGAIFTMWANINYAAHPIWVFVILNSFVHTIMYTYYAATTLGLNPPYKQYITRLQLTQFFVGQCIGASYFLVSNGPTRGGECFTRAGPRFAIGSVMLYVAPLIWLFVEFARRIYGKRKQA